MSSTNSPTLHPSQEALWLEPLTHLDLTNLPRSLSFYSADLERAFFTSGRVVTSPDGTQRFIWDVETKAYVEKALTVIDSQITEALRSRYCCLDSVGMNVLREILMAPRNSSFLALGLRLHQQMDPPLDFSVGQVQFEILFLAYIGALYLDAQRRDNERAILDVLDLISEIYSPKVFFYFEIKAQYILQTVTKRMPDPMAGYTIYGTYAGRFSSAERSFGAVELVKFVWRTMFEDWIVAQPETQHEERPAVEPTLDELTVPSARAQGAVVVPGVETRIDQPVLSTSPQPLHNPLLHPQAHPHSQIHLQTPSQHPAHPHSQPSPPFNAVATSSHSPPELQHSHLPHTCPVNQLASQQKYLLRDQEDPTSFVGQTDESSSGVGQKRKKDDEGVAEGEAKSNKRLRVVEGGEGEGDGEDRIREIEK